MDYTVTIINGTGVDISSENVRQVHDDQNGVSLEFYNVAEIDEGVFKTTVVGGVAPNIWAFFGPKGTVAKEPKPAEEKGKSKVLDLFSKDN